MKKHSFLRTVLVIVMVFAMMLSTTVTALAAGSGTITITANGQAVDGNPERFTAFQIFTGTVGTDDEHRLVNLTWGSNINHGDTAGGLIYEMQNSDLPIQGGTFGDAFTTAWGTYESAYKHQMTDAEFVAYWLSEHDDDPEVANAFARIAAGCTTGDGTKSKAKSDSTGWEITELDDGYYIVKDNYVSTPGHETADDSVSTYILEVIGSVEVELKATRPTVEKKVSSAEGALTETYTDVTFTLTGTVSQNIGEYDTYSYKFTDTLAKGIAADTDTLTVEYKGKEFALTTDYAVSLTESGSGDGSHILTVTFTDLKKSLETLEPGIDLTDPAKADDIEIVVTYTAHLDENANVTSAGNKNDVVLEFSNDPYEEGKGETVADEVSTYTLALKILKEDENGEPIENVKFKLMKGSDTSDGNHKFATFADGSEGGEAYKTVKSWPEGTVDAVGDELTTDASGVINIHGLSTGTYALIETETKEDYEIMKPVVFTITGTVEVNGDLGTITLAKDSTNELRDDVEVADSNFGAHTAQLTLTNYPAPILPHTGGIGAAIVYGIGGAALAAGFVIVIVLSMKKDKKSGNDKA